ncbi:MAG: DUF5518 domain-containing protein [Haloferacaceae archaeon]
MVPDASPTGTVDAPARNDGDGARTLIHAVVGAVAGTVLAFVPLSPLLGGVVAGYLEGGDPQDGLKVGAVAGAIMVIPFVCIGLLLTVLLGFGIGTSAVAFGVVALVVVLIGALYTVGLSVVGGYLGGYLEREL